MNTNDITIIFVSIAFILTLACLVFGAFYFTRVVPRMRKRDQEIQRILDTLDETPPPA